MSASSSSEWNSNDVYQDIQSYRDIGHINDDESAVPISRETVEQVLQTFYLTPFSKKMITERFLELASNPETFEDIQRLNAWFACESCGIRGHKVIQFTHSNVWKKGPKNGQEEAMPTLSSWQKGCPELLPGLRATPIWYRDEKPVDSLPESLQWISELKRAFPEIRNELLALRGQGQFQQYRAPVWSNNGSSSSIETQEVTKENEKPTEKQYDVSHTSGDWSVAYLDLHNVDNSEVRSKCPKTMEILSQADRFYGHSLFSVLTPGTHITPHNGPTNKKLRIHLGLVVPDPESCYLRVADENVQLREGEVCVFDDSFEHEASNNGNSSRIVLIIDVWHPDLSVAEERKCVQLKILGNIQKGQLRAAREAQQHSANGAGDFYKIIEESKANPTDDESIFQGIS